MPAPRPGRPSDAAAEPGPDRPRLLTLAAGVAAVQAVGVLVYVAFLAVEAVREGATGPADVSSGAGLVAEIALFAFLGAGLALVAVGLWRARRWARAPYLLGQLFGLVVGFPLVQAADTSPRAAGLGIVAASVLGLGLAFAPSVARALMGESDAGPKTD